MRILTAVVGIPLAILLIFAETDIPFAVAIGLISVMGAHEFYNGMTKMGARPIRWAGITAVAMFVLAARGLGQLSLTAIFPAILTALIFLSFTAEMARKERAPLVNIGGTVYGAIYVGWLISHLIVLRNMPGKLTVCDYTADLGSWFVMLTFLCTWACDTGAYFTGQAIGKHKLAPHLSPNKTIEGAVGGLLGSVIIACVAIPLMGLPFYHGIILGVLTGVLSQVGDLSESAIKREIGIKDFGKFVPGHGGILDRFDSILFTAPAVYYYVIIILKDVLNII